MSEVTSIKVIIKGRVQGVYFRAHTQKTARALNLTGYVKNRSDGSVEAVFQGEKARVQKIMEWCSTGAPSSRVDHVLQQSMDFSPHYQRFDIQY